MKILIIISAIWFLSSILIATFKIKGTLKDKLKNFVDFLLPPYFILRHIVSAIYIFIFNIIHKNKSNGNQKNN